MKRNLIDKKTFKTEAEKNGKDVINYQIRIISDKVNSQRIEKKAALLLQKKEKNLKQLKKSEEPLVNWSKPIS